MELRSKMIAAGARERASASARMQYKKVRNPFAIASVFFSFYFEKIRVYEFCVHRFSVCMQKTANAGNRD